MVSVVMEVTAVDSLIVPGSACIGLIMHEHGASHRAKGHSVVVKESEHLRIG